MAGSFANVGALDGWPAAVGGAELAFGWKDRLAEAGVRFHEEHVDAVRVQGRRRIVENRWRPLPGQGRCGGDRRKAPPAGVPGETEMTGRGVSQCAFCDAGFFRDGECGGRGRRRCGPAGSPPSRGLCALDCDDCARQPPFGAGRDTARGAAADPKFRFHWNSEVRFPSTVKAASRG